MSFEKDAVVEHLRHGRGQVVLDQDESVIARFEHGIEECLASELTLIVSLSERIAAGRFDPALHVLARILSECIRSVNDAWGVFSRSRIALLPHQLWVCKRVLESWPTRWLVADDVGLGKTIEAGLVLTPLLSSGRVRRLLILAPASLVEQWQVRLREMFDIRMSVYAAVSDTSTGDYWNTHDRVVASAHTLRLDKGGRWSRLLAAEPWDLVLVDEAHHMNVQEDGERTLAYRFVEGLQEHGRIRSLVLFTGTPHRGKDRGFLSLLKLLRPDQFDPEQPLEEQLEMLRSVMIRNNKHSVTDMAGRRLFTDVRQRRETYAYSPSEARFYEKLTQFIISGRAYAASLGSQDGRVVMLVLITMQKLASSSVAAVRRALTRRLGRLREAQAKLDESEEHLVRMEELRAEGDPSSFDEVSRLEELVAELRGVDLNPNEIPALEELLEAARAVLAETKVERILEVVDESFEGRSVLFFTEYKATQALLMSALNAKYGDGCVTFINGDGFLDEVVDGAGRTTTCREDRQAAAARFNRGEVRFLVSTEAAGEGIDLQEHCSALIHVDLPWNPMRLHQRVGRLSRYGQREPVDVVTVRNPDTVESRIWELLDSKLERITLAFRGAMDDPEDMRELVVGMASSAMFTKVFSEAAYRPQDQTLAQWFNTETSTFGGEDAVNTVRDLFGHVSRFDFGEVSNRIPRVDLPQLVPFMKAVLAVRGRRPGQRDKLRLSVRTPQEWQDDFAVADQYELLFGREPRPAEGEDIAGVGHRVVDRALQDAADLPAAFGAVAGLDTELLVFVVRDRITGSDGPVRSVVVGVTKSGDGNWELVRDWDVILQLGPLADKPRSPALSPEARVSHGMDGAVESAQMYLEGRLDALELPFTLPTVEPLCCLVPG